MSRRGVENGYFILDDEVVGSNPTIWGNPDVAQLAEREKTVFDCSRRSFFLEILHVWNEQTKSIKQSHDP